MNGLAEIRQTVFSLVLRRCYEKPERIEPMPNRPENPAYFVTLPGTDPVKIYFDGDTICLSIGRHRQGESRNVLLKVDVARRLATALLVMADEAEFNKSSEMVSKKCNVLYRTTREGMQVKVERYKHGRIIREITPPPFAIAGDAITTPPPPRRRRR
jgi:hypothetical protein